MVQELLRRVEQAEAQAESVRLEAVESARKIVQTAREECAADERNELEENRVLAREEIKKAQEKTAQDIAAKAEILAEDREMRMSRAKNNVPEVAMYIVERMIDDGHR